jgi:hypothetical protein
MNAGRKWPPQAQARQHGPGPQPARPQGPKVLQPKSASPQARNTPVAPPVYRPQPAPQCLQPKAAGPQRPSPGRVNVAPAAPPAYRPQPAPKVLQTKPHAAHAHRPPASAMPPPVFTPARPQPPQNVAQPKAVQGRQTPPAAPERPAVVQLAKVNKKNKVNGISSVLNPNHNLTGRLEKNPKTRPRLMPLSTWNRLKKKHVVKGYRKYVAIRHQNLETDTGSEDLMLVIRLNHRSKFGSRRESHYSGIEKRSHKKRQTPQNRTEMVGEVVAATYMEQYAGSTCKLLFGYGSGGAGIDQLWVNHTQQTYYVVEAKGPGAKLTTNRFAVRGTTNGGSVTQMSQQWVANRLTRLKSKCPDIFDTLLDDCGLEVNGSFVQSDNTKVAKYDIKGLIITAGWNETTGELTHNVSKRNYTF